jgi:hypothetical protein
MASGSVNSASLMSSRVRPRRTVVLNDIYRTIVAQVASPTSSTGNNETLSRRVRFSFFKAVSRESSIVASMNSSGIHRQTSTSFSRFSCHSGDSDNNRANTTGVSIGNSSNGGSNEGNRRREAHEAGFVSSTAVRPARRGTVCNESLKPEDLKSLEQILGYQTTLNYLMAFCKSS